MCPSLFPASRPAGENWRLQKLAERTKFSDIFETAPFDPATGCPAGFKSTNADEANPECLRLKVRGRMRWICGYAMPACYVQRVLHVACQLIPAARDIAECAA